MDAPVMADLDASVEQKDTMPANGTAATWQHGMAQVNPALRVNDLSAGAPAAHTVVLLHGWL
jgi:hypothetical protein